MPIRNQEFRELLHHVREELYNSAYSYLDESIMRDFQPTQEPRNDFIRYLKTLLTAIQESSSSGYNKTLKILRETINTESSEGITGIRITLSPEEQEFYKTESIDLSHGPDLSEFSNDIKQLIISILEDNNDKNGRTQ